MACHWGFGGLTEPERRERWEEYIAEPGRYETPVACPRAYLPLAGEGHWTLGLWPPRDVPDHIWQALHLYGFCDQWQTLPADGGMLAQCSWTMDAFSVIAATKAQIREAKMRWETRKREKGGR